MRGTLTTDFTDDTDFYSSHARRWAYVADEVNNPTNILESMKTYRRFLGGAALGILGILTFPACGAEGSYKLLKEIPVGGEGGWDYLTVDESARRLYVSHGTKVEVIDLDKESGAGQIA